MVNLKFLFYFFVPNEDVDVVSYPDTTFTCGNPFKQNTKICEINKEGRRVGSLYVSFFLKCVLSLTV